jgi:hypothetical protein
MLPLQFLPTSILLFLIENVTGIIYVSGRGGKSAGTGSYIICCGAQKVSLVFSYFG